MVRGRRFESDRGLWRIAFVSRFSRAPRTVPPADSSPTPPGP
jgi:hypothetical protein